MSENMDLESSDVVEPLQKGEEDGTENESCDQDSQRSPRSQQMDWPELPPLEYYSRAAITDGVFSLFRAFIDR